MGRKKRNPKKKPKRKAPEKLQYTKKANAKGGHDASFQQRIEIWVLAARGATISEIVESLGCSKDMALRWSKRSEEVVQKVEGFITDQTCPESRALPKSIQPNL